MIELPADLDGDDLYGRRGDLALRAPDGASVVFAATEDRAHTRPMRGSAVDLRAGRDGGLAGDGLLWWRTGVLLADGTFSSVVASVVQRMRCEQGGEGVKIVGDAAGARVETHACAAPGGGFSLESRALRGMPAGASLADELNTGAESLYASGVGEGWDESVESEWLAFGGGGVGAALRFDRRRAVARKVFRVAGEVFRGEARVSWGGASAVRTLHVAAGDALSAIGALPGATRRATVRFGDARGGTVVLRGARGAVLGEFVRATARAEIAVPEGFGEAVSLRDHAGIARGEPRAIAGTIALEPARMGVIRATYVDEAGSGAPTHIVLKGLDGTEDPTPTSSARRYASRSTLYAVDGWAEIPVRPGRYRVVGTRGPAHSLSVREVTVADGAVVEVRDVLRREVDTSRYTAGDFHLHAARSPDSTVSNEARVASLACAGIEVAVASDHNAVTDYGPAVRALGLEGALATIAGDEVTTGGPSLGHFNVFPLVGAGYGAALPYYGVSAADLVRSARQAGASILQVNHARMSPGLGYFDLTSFDARTGRGGPAFDGRFDAFEAFNGMYLQEPERVREGVRDVVGLARAGLRPGVTANSDSHHLVFEEAGWPRTYVRVPPAPIATRATRVMEAVRQGFTTASSGPLVELWVDDREPGESVIRAGGARRVRARVRVSAAGWVPLDRVELWVNDRVAIRAPIANGANGANGGLRFEQTFELTLARDSLVIAWASGEAPLPHVLPYPNARAMGFTAPVWVDADGDGAVRIAEE